VVRSGRWRLRLVALIAYYTVVIVIVGPMCLSPAGADPGTRVPVLISLNLAMRTKTTDITTFTTPVPITVGVASDGTFTLPANALAFNPVDVPVATLGLLTVRAAATSDFYGTINTTTGAAALDGSLELWWSKPSSTYSPAQMLDCPVGPFVVHLSTTTTGGAALSTQSLLDPTSRTATLVDSNLSAGAIPAGTAQCAGNERTLNQALSLPILPTTTTTTSTTSTSTTTSAPVSSTTTTIAPTTTTSTSTATTVAPTTPGAPTTGGLAFEPIPSVVATLTIATVPPSTSATSPIGSATTTGGPSGSSTAAIPATAATPAAAAQANATNHQRLRTVKPAKQPRHKHNTNRHAQTDATTMVNGTNPHVNATPPLYFSPSYFGSPLRLTAHNLLPASAPLSNLGNSVTHKDASSILFIALLSLPLVAFGLGLIASDLGWQPRTSRRRRHPAPARRKPSLSP
jgi:hypothetical protein